MDNRIDLFLSGLNYLEGTIYQVATYLFIVPKRPRGFLWHEKYMTLKMTKVVATNTAFCLIISVKHQSLVYMHCSSV